MDFTDDLHDLCDFNRDILKMCERFIIPCGAREERAKQKILKRF
jgi:hypothetical protein